MASPEKAADPSTPVAADGPWREGDPSARAVPVHRRRSVATLSVGAIPRFRTSRFREAISGQSVGASRGPT